VLGRVAVQHRLLVMLRRTIFDTPHILAPRLSVDMQNRAGAQ
jgi:hypothetical protein